MRIVSLLPSATEIICGLGLRHQLVGVTHECDYPPDVVGLPIVTSSRIPKGLSSAEIDAQVNGQLDTDSALYSLDKHRLEHLQPDLIVTQALCDVCAVSADEVNAISCQLPGDVRVVNLEPSCLKDVLDTVLLVGEAAGCVETAQQYHGYLDQRVAAVAQRSQRLGDRPRPRVAILEWIDPLFDGGHWYPELIGLAGGTPCFGDRHGPSRRRNWSDLVAAAPDVLLVSLCGFDLQRTAQDIPLLTNQPDYGMLPAAKTGQVFAVDGNRYFSRPGPSLVDSLEILANLLHPDIHPLPSGLAPAMHVSTEEWS
ncbi:MAG: cobalamin-binding protein [Gammaproteobacteria bacterium]|nr:MAG: cobalamin-binding protein [Gammaproteobacteria bacterium]